MKGYPKQTCVRGRGGAVASLRECGPDPLSTSLPPGVSCFDHGHAGHGRSAGCAALRQPHDEPPGDAGSGRHLHDTGKGPRSGVLAASAPISVVAVATALASHVVSVTRLSTRCIIPYVHKRIECLFVLILGGGCGTSTQSFDVWVSSYFSLATLAMGRRQPPIPTSTFSRGDQLIVRVKNQ
jgi:hypothetical protein